MVLNIINSKFVVSGSKRILYTLRINTKAIFKCISQSNPNMETVIQEQSVPYTRPLGVSNGQVDSSVWERYEGSLGQTSQEALNKVSEDAKSIGAETYSQAHTSQEVNPRSNPQVWVNERKKREFCDKLGLSPLAANVQIDSVSNKGQKGQKNSLDKVKIKVSLDRAKEDYKKFVGNDGKVIPSPVGSGNLDLTIAAIISHLNAMITNRRKVEEKDLYEAFFGIGNVINRLRTIRVLDDITNEFITVHEIIIGDLEQKYRDFMRVFRFDYKIASSRYPRIFYQTKYDKILPGMSISSYPSQIQMLKTVNNCIRGDREFLLVLNTLMGMGKTTLVAGLAQLIERLDKTKTLLYVCPEDLKSVRETVGKNLKFLDIKFAVAQIDNDRIQVKEQNRCKFSPDKPTVILAGIKSGLKLLKEKFHQNKTYVKPKVGPQNVSYDLNPNDYVLFFDENTISLDMTDSPMIPFLSEFYQYLPRHSIFTSATHENIENLPELMDLARSKYPNILFESVNRSKVLIGTQLNKMDGTMIIPHSVCSTPNELERYIVSVEQNLMFKKHYTLPLVSSMYDKLVELGCVVPPHLLFQTYMDDFAHRNQEAIQNLGIEYLKLVLELSVIRPGIIPEFNNISETNIPIDYSDLVRSYEVLSGQTFISCFNPREELLAKFSEHFRLAMEEMGIRSFDDLFKSYKNLLVAHEKRVASASKAKKSSENEGMSRLEREMAQSQERNDISIPTIPSKFLLGKRTCKISFSLNSTNWDDILVDDIFKFAALFGIVVYSERSSQSYHDLVVDMISTGNCAYVFADSSLNYGNSFPFNNGIILSDMASHSAKTLFQLFARAGRPGISDSAIIYAADPVISKVMDCIHNPDYLDIETINLNRSVQKAKTDIVKAITNEAEKLRLEEETRALAEQRELDRQRAEEIAFLRIIAEKEAEDLAKKEAENLAKKEAEEQAKSVKPATKSELAEQIVQIQNDRRSVKTESDELGDSRRNYGYNSRAYGSDSRAYGSDSRAYGSDSRAYQVHSQPSSNSDQMLWSRNHKL